VSEDAAAISTEHVVGAATQVAAAAGAAARDDADDTGVDEDAEDTAAAVITAAEHVPGAATQVAADTGRVAAVAADESAMPLVCCEKVFLFLLSHVLGLFSTRPVGL